MENLTGDIADFFIAQNWISAEEKAVYKIGIDVLLTSFGQLALLVLVGLFLHDVVCAAIFWLCFATIREYSGGYHAPNRFLCNCTMALAFLAVWSGSLMIVRYHLESCCAVGMSVVVIVIFWRNVPSGNTAKKITQADRKRFRKKAIGAMLLWETAAFAVSWISITYSLQIICTEFVIAILIILSKLKGEKNE